MPVKINFLQGGRGIEFISSGVVTGKEIIDANKKIYTENYLKKCKYKVVDRSSCTDYQVTSKEVEIIAKQDLDASKINPKFEIILISTSDLQFGVSRMWQAISSEAGLESKIFRDRDTAYDYIEKTYPSSCAE